MKINPAPAHPDLGAAVSAAWNRTRGILFRPFRPALWMALGFCCWLARLGEAGGSLDVGDLRGPSRPDALQRPGEVFGRLPGLLRENALWLVPLLVVLVGVGLVLALALMWVRCRGRLMFLDGVVHGRAEIGRAWTAYAREANDLFLLRLLVAALTLVPTLPLVGLGLFLGFGAYRSDGPLRPPILAGLVLVVLLFAGVLLLAAVFDVLTDDFAVPILLRRRAGMAAAWGTLLRLLMRHPGAFLVYLVGRLLLGVAGALATGILVLGTCCLAGCVILIPFLGTVFLLPLHVFNRSLGPEFLAQFGPEHDVFRGPEA